MWEALAALPTWEIVLLVVALSLAFGFEFVNGFHDAANAVATVIYTRSLRPSVAVAWSGLFNFLGTLVGGVGVAYVIVHLLPVDLLVNVNGHAGLAMVLALLGAAILWNVGTWYLGIPASSSHTLIGSILGVGIANSLFRHGTWSDGVNMGKLTEVGISLLLSPLLGFLLSGVLLLLLKRLRPHPQLHQPPTTDHRPPGWIRGLLIATCTGVSFAHGSNDGQKGMGLVMLILLGVLPTHFALNLGAERGVRPVEEAVHELHAFLSAQVVPENGFRRVAYGTSDELQATLALTSQVARELEGKQSFADIPAERRWEFRQELFAVSSVISRYLKAHPDSPEPQKQHLLKLRKEIRGAIEYIPAWVVVCVALCLGIGTTVGWKRIVVTVGEKIGKSHLTYGQGATAELVAMSTIGFADVAGLPVSTTHVLSSGVAGTMWANRSGLNLRMVQAIAIAWCLTIPVSMALAGGLFALFRAIL